MELAVKPAVNDIARTIISTLVSTDFFGLYDVSVLVIISDNKNISHNLLKESVHQRLHVYQRDLAVYFDKEELIACKVLGNWITDVNQILGKGDYIQLSSSSYIARFKYFNQNSYNQQYCDFDIVKENDELVYEGVSKNIIIEDGNYFNLGKCLSDMHPRFFFSKS
jgi:hypothetical protein